MSKIRKKSVSLAVKILCLMFALVIVAGNCLVSVDAKNSYISEVTVAVGENAVSTLEGKGYTVLFQGMNIVTSEGATVYLGYKKGATAITDFVVSTQRSGTVTYGDVTYRQVSDVNLNVGTDGTPIYLYYTKDISAGGKITSLDTVSGFSDKDEVVSLKNDGSSPVRMNDGTLANFDKGIDGNELYLLMYRDSGIRRYISNVCIVTGSSKAQAVNSAASKGCDYYLDNDMSDGETVMYIAYQRTADKNDAITKLNIDGTELSFDKNKQAKSFLLDISNEKLFDESFSLGDWAGIYASYDKSVSKRSDGYKALLNSKVNCSCVLTGGLGIYAVYEGDVKSTYVESSETTVAEENITGEDATDEYYDIDKSVTTVVEEDNSEAKSTASIINNGSVIAILCFLIIVILILIGAIIYKKKGRNKKI